MGHVMLSEYDQERYGVPGRVDFPTHRFGMRAIKALRNGPGYDYATLARLLRGVPKVDRETSEPVYRLDADGNPVLDADGNPTLKLDYDEDAIVAFVWLVLWSAGHRLDWHLFDLDSVGLKVDFTDDGDEDDAGKEEGPSSSTATDPT